MKIAVVGAGAMGSVMGGLLAKAGNEVTLIDVWREAIEAINARGLRIDDKAGNSETLSIRATANPSEVGPVEMALVFVKCYHTESAVRAALPLIGPRTAVLSLQNGWGNGPRIASIVGQERLLLGVCYHSATVAGPGHVQHVGRGMTFLGEPGGQMSERLQRVTKTFSEAGIEVTATSNVVKEIWSKLALNACTLPTSALLRFFAPQLVQHSSMLELMQALLREVVSVARAEDIPLEFDERWEAITTLLKRCAPNAKPSMLQDVEKGRRTEIDVINGAVMEAGDRLRIPTPYNEAMVWLVRSLEETFQQSPRT
ncbi:MAG: 2-dehydropantoate 2-reductase [Acidobacteria bacterium]|nr:2-dehydropantoate 2-reductase [Acidobacteriota bacterium]